MTEKIRLQTHVCADPSSHRVAEYPPLHEGEAEHAEVVYVCGRCDAVLLAEGRGMLVMGALYHCGQCGSYNISPSD